MASSPQEHNYINIAAVVVPEDRQRKKFNPNYLAELKRSLRSTHGLLHPIILRNDGVTLVAGECRLRATRELAEEGKGIRFAGVDLPPGAIPFTLLGDLSPLALREAELHENIHREDISWQERVAAEAALDALRREQNPSHTRKETAAEVFQVPVEDVTPERTHSVTNSVILAENLHRPEIAKAGSKREALKALEKSLANEMRVELARRAPILNTTHSLIHGSLFVEIPKLADGSIDVIIADPPYGIRADTAFGNMAELDHEYVDSPEVAEEIYQFLAGEVTFAKCKPQAHAYIFLDLSWWDMAIHYFEEGGWWVWPRPLIWDKTPFGMLPHPHHGPRYSYEMILYAIKGKRPTTAAYNDVLRYSGVRDNRVHAAQKPVALYADLLRRSCNPGDVVLDPCCGSGTILPAATAAKVKAIAIEQEEKHYAAAFARLKGEGKQEEAAAPLTTADL